MGFIIILYAAFIMVGVYIYYKIYKRYGLIHPLIWIYLDGFLNYYFRSYVLLTTGQSVVPNLAFTHSDVFYALLFVTIIFLERIWIYKPKPKIEGQEECMILPIHTKIFYVASAAVIFASCYNIYNGNIYSLGDSFMESQNSFTDQLVGEINGFRFFVIFLGTYCYNHTHKKKMLILIAIIMLLLLFFGVVSTAKGKLLNLIVAFFFVLQILKVKVNYKIVAPLSIFFMFAFSHYSYYTRQYGVVSGKYETRDLIENYNDYQKNDVGSVNYINMLQRYYYLDPIIFLENNSITNREEYEYGSIRDLQGIIPRALYPDKPKNLNYGLFTGKSIFENGWAEEPIGRLGELFSLFGFFTIILYPFIAKIGQFFFNKLYEKGDVLEKSMYLCMFFVFFSSDSGWLTYGYRIFFESLILLFALRMYVVYKTKIKV